LDNGLKKSKKKLRIVVKYCGGCNPGYDRVAAVSRIQNSFKKKADFSLFESEFESNDENPDFVIVLYGCETSCTDLTYFKGVNILSISSEKEVDNIIDHLQNIKG
jgi:hypothetical protein